jgi:hypothetical protein
VTVLDSVERVFRGLGYVLNNRITKVIGDSIKEDFTIPCLVSTVWLQSIYDFRVSAPHIKRGHSSIRFLESSNRLRDS